MPSSGYWAQHALGVFHAGICPEGLAQVEPHAPGIVPDPPCFRHSVLSARAQPPCVMLGGCSVALSLSPSLHRSSAFAARPSFHCARELRPDGAVSACGEEAAASAFWACGEEAAASPSETALPLVAS